MEGIHGVDVSWTHHSQPLDRKLQLRTTPLAISTAPQSPITTPQRHLQTQTEKFPELEKSISKPRDDAPTTSHSSTTRRSSPPPSTSPSTQAAQSPLKKAGGLLRRNSKEVNALHAQQHDAPKNSPRRSSWMSSISSKLSSQPASSPQPTTINANGQIAQTPPGTALQRTVSPGSSSKTGYFEDVSIPASAAGKPGGNNFFSSALKRLSSNSQITPSGRSSTNGSICQRRVLNIDPNRQRCLVPELNVSKLRRVAFCVDVEIASGSRHDNHAAQAKNPAGEDNKIQERNEGEALKDPSAVLKEKEVSDANEEDRPAADLTPKVEKKEMTRKKEKKRKSEEERKERNEQKRRRAEESGSIPMVYTRPANHSAASKTTAKPGSRPTIDPLRIYRRCCQLRETPVLKRITEQLSTAAASPDVEPGTVPCLDLTGSRLQSADIATLGDWLAIVPVQKLLVEDSDLNDEGLRVILAGLLAAGYHDFVPITIGTPREERSGVVEKLSLKNNPKISKVGWKHISLFIYMCKSLKALDLSMLRFPAMPGMPQTPGSTQQPEDIAEIFAKAISERHGGNRLEELLLGDCNLKTPQVRRIVDAVMMCGIVRLGLARNDLDLEALEHLSHYIHSGTCHGLDLGGNNLREHLHVIGEAFSANDTMWALALADCNLDVPALKTLFPGILNLHVLRFLDLSYNPELFNAETSSLPLLRHYLPMLTMLRRIHLTNCDITPAQAIALANVLAEGSQLAHLNILGNPRLAALAAATDDDSQEEAVALYASLMAACRVSTTLISIDIEVPTPENSEIVKALAKQMVAYALRNIEQWTLHPASDSLSLSSDETSYSMDGSISHSRTVSRSTDGQLPQLKQIRSNVKDVEVPEVLQHIVGEDAILASAIEADEEDRDHDYIVSGTGVVRALNYCLANESMGGGSLLRSGTASPAKGPPIAAKAKAMSKDLLDSARKIRSRLQPPLLRESRGNNYMAYRRLLFLDNTLRGIIERFEAEYPETRITTNDADRDDETLSRTTSKTSVTALTDSLLSPMSPTSPTKPSLGSTLNPSDSDSDGTGPEAHADPHQRRLSKRGSEASLAARAQVAEEGKVLRIGQQLHKAHGQQASDHVDDAGEEEHVRILREKLQALNAE